MPEKIRPIDAKAAGQKVSDYMREHANTPGKYVACMGIIGILGREEETPTLAGFVPDYGSGPLTLEQLRERFGLPVFVVSKDERKFWALVNRNSVYANNKDVFFLDGPGYGTTWLAYPYPPARIDREKWELCEWCGSVGKTPDNWVCTLEDENGHTVTNQHIVVCVTANYCPSCGRPLTPEAWEELERRINA